MPIRAMANPASAGPTTRVVETAAMLSAIALVRRLRPTVLATIAWRAGMIERERGAHQGFHHQQVPVGEVIGDQEPEHGELPADDENLARGDHAAAVEAVGEGATERRHHQHREGDQRADEPEGQLVAGDLEHQPRAQHRLPAHGQEERVVGSEQPAELGDRQGGEEALLRLPGGRAGASGRGSARSEPGSSGALDTSAASGATISSR